jgi:Cdc6-like AAA superfamily ATPase
MALRAKKPTAIQKRLKFFLYGSAGVGKTMSAIQWMDAYLIDCERGAEEASYVKQLAKAGSEIFQTNELDDIMEEVRQLRAMKHNFRTIIIDPITPPYHNKVIQMEPIVGTDYGAHYTAARKELRRLFKLLMLLDMNVIMTAHAKFEYGEEMKRIGITFDAWDKLAYMFDLVLFMEKYAGKRVVTVEKTRIEGFVDGETFEWSYAEFVRRYGETIEKEAVPAVLATEEQIDKLGQLLEVVQVPDGTVDKWLKKASVDGFEDMTLDQVTACIDWLESRAKGNGK